MSKPGPSVRDIAGQLAGLLMDEAEAAAKLTPSEMEAKAQENGLSPEEVRLFSAALDLIMREAFFLNSKVKQAFDL